MTRLDSSPILKRSRPKTHWGWYVGAVSAFLILGLTVAYAIEKSNNGAKLKANTNTSVAISNMSKLKHWTFSLKKSMAEAKPKAQTPAYSSREGTSNTTQSKSTVVQNAKKNSEATTSSYPPTKTKQRRHAKQKNISGQVNSSTSVSDTKTPMMHEKGPIIKLLDDVTNTIRYLLTGNQQKLH